MAEPKERALIDTKPAGNGGPYNVSLTGYFVIGALCALPCVVGAMAAFHERHYRLALSFAGLASLGLVLLLFAGDVAGRMSVCLASFGCFGSMFEKSNRAFWSGAAKQAASELLCGKVKESGIVVAPSNTTAYKWQKTVRVRRTIAA